MILTTDLKYNKFHPEKLVLTQRVEVQCDNPECRKIYSSKLGNQIKGHNLYGKDLCVGCKQHVQYLNGQRNSLVLNN